ncbi:MAG: HNH endonuclease [Sphaerochaetaceae bacterium]
MRKHDVTQQELSERLSYDPLSGELTWIAKGNARKVVVGSRAGSISPHGHRVIRLNGFLYPEHHIIWRLHHGVWPTGFLDHNDHNEQNNKLLNLTDVTQAVNNRNQSKRSDNSTGHTGIWINKQNSKKKFMAEVTFEGKRVHLKSHYSIEDAIADRNAVLDQYGFHPNHGIDKPI